MSLWSLEAMKTAMAAEVRGEAPAMVTGIGIDSRACLPGDAFFAIRGDIHDGHDFVAKALAAGAAVAVVSRQWAATAPEGRYLVVDDVLDALRALARAARARSTAKIIAVTGSVGKTSTKEALREVLAAQGRTHAAVSSFNNHWGVPLTLARMPADCAYGIFEIGMNHSGEIVPLVAMVQPHVAVITNVEGVHLAHFNSVEEIADAKAEIFTGIVPGGAALINGDNAFAARLRQQAEEAGVARILTFGEAAGSDARLDRLVLKADASLIDANILGTPITYRLGAAGKHLALNSLAVLAAVDLVGGDIARAALTLGQVAAVKGRGARSSLATPSGEATLIDESYNANPVSMRAALAVLGAAEAGLHGRRIAVLGDMRELGPEADALHAGLADSIIAERADLVFCCGPHMRALWTALPQGKRGAHADDVADLEAKVVATVRGGDVVMVKASNGTRLWTLVETLKKRFATASAA